MTIVESARELLKVLNFKLKNGVSDEIYEKYYQNHSKPLCVNLTTEYIGYYEFGIGVGRNTTSNFSDEENLVVLECVDKLLGQGYSANAIELEKRFGVGRSGGGWLDIMVYKDDIAYMMIDCKVYGKKYQEAKKQLLNRDNQNDNNQLLSYFSQDTNADVLCLYGSCVEDGEITRQKDIIYTANLKECHNATEVYQKMGQKII